MLMYVLFHLPLHHILAMNISVLFLRIIIEYDILLGTFMLHIIKIILSVPFLNLQGCKINNQYK